MLSPSAKVRRGLISLGVVWHGAGRKRQKGPLLTGWADFFKGKMMQANFVQQAEAEVQRLTGAWRGGPSITVVATPADLPVKAPSDARGLFRTGGIWLVASTQPAKALADAVNHEAIAHFGLRQLYGRHWQSFMQGVRVGARSGDCELLEMQYHVHRAYGRGTLSPIQEADEISAAVAETHTKLKSGRIEIKMPIRKRAMAAWGFIAREGLYFDQPVSGKQLQGALLEAQHRIRYGGPIFGIEARLRRWYASAMSKPWNPKNRPMSLSESEDLLSAGSGFRASMEGLKVLFQLLLALAIFIGGIAALVWWVIKFF